jgi:hypothetical protein
LETEHFSGFESFFTLPKRELRFNIAVSLDCELRNGSAYFNKIFFHLDLSIPPPTGALIRSRVDEIAGDNSSPAISAG